MNIVANLGQRFGNWSNPANRTRQIIANTNIFTQFNEHFSLNASYNNFGFQTQGLSGIKNVGNDLGINPAYTWSTNSMSNFLSLTYNWSKYDETIFPANTLTSNNSHTAMLMYVPTFFSKPNLSTDISAMYFKNAMVPSNTDLSIYTISASAGYNSPKQNYNLKGQLQYNISTIDPYTASKNMLATIGFDMNLSKKLTWNTTVSVNLFKYGDELTPPATLLGAKYTESMLKTALLYKFGN
jgi:hypothetical protein